MEIKGKVHCFFEQSGTFKQEFIKLGIPAEDYDIQNHFGQTDHTDDLFQAIEDAYDGKPSLFDNITPDDLIMAFFPCIYFSCMSQMDMSFTAKNYRRLSWKDRTDAILQRSHNREKFFGLITKMFAVCYMRGLRMIVENPWSMQTFLKSGFIQAPSLIDQDRTKRGDYFVKPTAYWFVNCEPTHGKSYVTKSNRSPIDIAHLPPGKEAGLCSEERSMMHPDYARNFICDFILGKEQPHTMLTLFD